MKVTGATAETTRPLDEGALLPRIQVEQLKIAYKNFPIVFFTVPFAVLAISLVEMTEPYDPVRLAAWGLPIIIWTLARYYLFREFRKAESYGIDYKLWANRFLAVTAIAGLLWGITPFYLFPGDSLEHQVFITLVIVGMASVASFVYAAFARPAQVFITLSLLPLALAFVMPGGGIYYGMAAMAVVFYAMLMVSLKNNSRLVYESIKLGLENSGLVNNLTIGAKERAIAEERLNRAQRVAHIGNWNWDIRLNRFSMSEETCHILGLAYAECEMTYENLIDTVPQEDADGVKKAIYETIFEGKPLDIEHSIVIDDGTVKSVHQLAEVTLDNNGEPVEIEATIQDITERKKSELRIKDALDFSRKILESSPIGITVYNSTGQCILANEAMGKVIGATREQALSQNFRHLESWKRSDMLKKAEKALQENTAQLTEAHIVTTFGKEDWLRSLFIPFNQGGEPHLMLMAEDITERKIMETRLRENEERFRSLINSMQEGVFVLDKNQRFVGVFGKWLEREGIEPDEFIGRTYREMFGREVGEIHQKATSKALMGEPVTFQWSMEWLDEHDFYQTSVSPFTNAQGEIVGVVGVNRDITELKKKEEELFTAKQKAEEATKIKDKFISIVAHDIRGPFGTIMELLKLALRDATTPLNEKHRQIIDRVVSSGKGMMEMFEELLNIGRLQTGALAPKLQFIDGHFAVASAIDKVKPLAEGKGIKIVNEIPLKTRLYADISLSTTVFQNLISNSIKFSRRGGEIRVFLPGDKQWTVAIKDNGMGIDTKLVPNLFKPDVKTTTVGTEGERGTGFGLPFCHEIMKAHGGNLVAESTLGEGSTFYVVFQPSRPRILVVDDEISIRALLTRCLSDMDASVFEAEDGDSAVRLIDDNDPHLVISDIKMPGMSGFELLESIRKDKRKDSTAFIMITGDMDEGASEKAFKLGANDFIRKPISTEEFISRVKRFVG